MLQDTEQFLLQVVAMVALSVLLYGWLLRGRYANMQVMLLVGIIIGGGLGSVSTFMQRLLTPSEFDVLTARLFGSVTNASVESSEERRVGEERTDQPGVKPDQRQ